MDNQLDQIDVDLIKEELFKDTPHHLVADIIATQNPELRITDRLIESYLELANSKEFTLDKTIYEIRKLNRFESTVDGKLIFELYDGSQVAISHDTISKLQESINSSDIVEFMRKNQENFIGVIDALEE